MKIPLLVLITYEGIIVLKRALPSSKLYVEHRSQGIGRHYRVLRLRPLPIPSSTKIDFPSPSVAESKLQVTLSRSPAQSLAEILMMTKSIRYIHDESTDRVVIAKSWVILLQDRT